MDRTIEGGIKEHQDLERFIASSADIAPKDQIDLMARCWFSLTPGRTEAIQHEYVDARSGQTETVRITGSTEHGIATIHDQDLLIYAISHDGIGMHQGFLPGYPASHGCIRVDKTVVQQFYAAASVGMPVKVIGTP